MDESVLVETLTKIKEAVISNKEDHAVIIKGLEKMNGKVAQNCIDIETGRTNDKWLWRVMTIVIIGLVGFILQYFLR